MKYKALLSVLSIMLLLTGVSHAYAKQYPLETRLTFMQYCAKNKRPLIKHCQCVLKAFEQRATHAQFKQLILNADANNPHLQVMADYCIKKLGKVVQ